MPRKPTLEDAFLLALLESGDDGLNNTKWYRINKPPEFQESYEDFMQLEDNLVRENLIEFVDFLDKYRLTEIGIERAHSIEGVIGRDRYISLIARLSPIEELRKRTQNIETFIISSFLALLSYIELLNLKNITFLPSYIILAMFFFS